MTQGILRDVWERVTGKRQGEVLLAAGSADGGAPGMPRRESDCYAYGFFYLEHDGSEPFRWSRRFWGWYLATSGLRHVRLQVMSATSPLLIGRLNGREVVRQQLSPGVHWILVPIDPETGSLVALDFQLSESWRPAGPDDPRTLGVQVRALVGQTETETIDYPLDRWRPNPVKEEGPLLDPLFDTSELRDTSGGGHRQANARLNVMERTAEQEWVTSRPLTVFLEVAVRCNLRCPSCFHAYLDQRQFKTKPTFLSPFLFQQVASALFPTASLVWYSGNGEALLHPNINAMLRTAQDFDFLPALLSNGSRFTPENMQLLVEGGFLLSVSVDSPNPPDFERLRQGASWPRFEGAIDHLRALQQARPGGRFNLMVQCVAQQGNMGQWSDLVRWAASKGIENVQFLPLHTFGLDQPYLHAARLQHTPDQANRAMLAAIREGTSLGVRVLPFPPLTADPSFLDAWQSALAANQRRPSRLEHIYASQAPDRSIHPANHPTHNCQHAWAECFISADGGIAPCDMDLARSTVGNLHDGSFPDLWNGPGLRGMRRTVNHDPDGPCAFGTCMFRPDCHRPKAVPAPL